MSFYKYFVHQQVALDGKPPSKDELEVSASISTAEKQVNTKKHKKVTYNRSLINIKYHVNSIK